MNTMIPPFAQPIDIKRANIFEKSSTREEQILKNMQKISMSGFIYHTI